MKITRLRTQIVHLPIDPPIVTAILGSIRSADCVLTTYETLRDYDRDFGQIRFVAAVFDEAQKIKTPGIRLTDAAKAMNIEFRVAMTGTPVENRLADLWCIVDAVHPGYLMIPPFYGATVWATLSNTQGGPVHDAKQRIIDVYGKPIPRLFAAGELGSSFGHLYMSGGKISECFVTGRIAGNEAAKLKPLQ